MPANFMQLLDDNMSSIIEKLDLISAINLLCSCKAMYDKRRVLMYDIRDVKKYREYFQGNIITTLFDSYVELGSDSVDIMQINNINKACLQKACNSMNIIAYTCYEDDRVFQKYTTNIYIVEMLCKAVCKEYKYKYSTPPANIYSLFWLCWFDINIQIIDICKIIYHVKNRKYRRLINTFTEIEFKDYKDGVMSTIDFMTRYVDLKQGNGMVLNTALVYVLYKFLEQNIDSIKHSKILCNVIIEKAYEFRDNISYELYAVPKYLKYFIIMQLLSVSDILRTIE